MRHALEDVELWAEATLQQLERMSEALRSGAFFGAGPKALRFDADTHLLVVAAEHLRKAVEGAPKGLGFGALSSDIGDAIEVLRDVYEHRDAHLRDRRGGRPPRKAAGRLAQAGSDNAFKTTMGEEEFIIGGVLPAIALSQEVERLQKRVAEIRRESDADTPPIRT